MNILFISTDPIPHEGGKSSHVLDLIVALKEKRNKVYLVSQRSLSILDKTILRLTALLFILFKKNSKYDQIKEFKQILTRKIEKIVRQKKINVISAQDIFSIDFVKNTPRLASVPIFLTMHTYFGIEPLLDQITGNIANEQDVFMKEIQNIKFVNGIICVDTRIKKHVEEIKNRYFPTMDIPITSMQNFTNTDRFNKTNDNRRDILKRKFGFNKTAFLLFCPRRLVEKNGVIYAIRAINIVLVEKKDVFLIIVGDGPQKDSIECLINELGVQNNIIMWGGINNKKIHKFYQISDCVLIPSITCKGLQEATSISAIEAMSCEVPVIASNIGGLAELIISNETGILVEEGNASEIAKNVLYLYNNKYERNRLGKNARERVIQFNSRSFAGQKYFDEFQKLVGLSGKD
jgi:glycogen synthase